MKTIKFPVGVSAAWRPKYLSGIDIQDIKVLTSIKRTNNGFEFKMCSGSISDEDATFLQLKLSDFEKRIIKLSK